MKIKDILKLKDIPSKEIELRFKNGNIKINNEVIKENIDLGDIDFKNDVQDVGEFIYNIIKKDLVDFHKLKIFELENLISQDKNINDKLTCYLSNFIFLKYSKKEMVVIKKLII